VPLVFGTPIAVGLGAGPGSGPADDEDAGGVDEVFDVGDEPEDDDDGDVVPCVGIDGEALGDVAGVAPFGVGDDGAVVDDQSVADGVVAASCVGLHAAASSRIQERMLGKRSRRRKTEADTHGFR